MARVVLKRAVELWEESPPAGPSPHPPPPAVRGAGDGGGGGGGGGARASQAEGGRRLPERRPPCTQKSELL